ncbi:MAG: DUF6338 family protein [Methanothrix sp.]|nr:DUF6338 family protein [Methanothrix sp.]
MAFWDTDPTYFLFFFIPGFIMVLFYNWLRKGLPSSQEQQKDAPLYLCLGYSGAYSFLWYPTLAYLSLLNFGQDHKYIYYFLLIFIFIVIPALLSVAYIKVNTKIRRYVYVESPSSRAWDCVFKDLEPCWARIYLKDSNVIGGKFGNNSFASAYPYEEQIYLEEIWILDEDGEFQEPLPGSKGMIILHDEIKAIEFLKGEAEK